MAQIDWGHKIYDLEEELPIVESKKIEEKLNRKKILQDLISNHKLKVIFLSGTPILDQNDMINLMAVFHNPPQSYLKIQGQANI